MPYLHCKQLSEGNADLPPLVLLHGFLANGQDWLPVVKALGRGISCYAIDLPGHGQSQKISLDEDGGFEQCSQLIAATLKHANIKRYVLLGYSLGGRIALYHATHRPNDICALILESCHIGLSTEFEKQQRLHHDTLWAERFRSLPIEETLTLWYQQAVFSSLSLSQQQALIEQRQQLDAKAIANMLVATSLAKQPAILECLTNQPWPLYYFCGDKDEKYTSICRQLELQHPDLKSFNFYDAGHNIHFEQPIDYAQKIIDIYHQRTFSC